MAWLRCDNALTRATKEVPLRKPITTLGRASGNDVVLDDPTLSPSHANLMKMGVGYTISVAGTGEVYVNGQRVRTAALNDGDRVLIGSWELSFHDGDMPAATPEPAAPSLDLLERLVQLAEALTHDTAPNRIFAQLLQSLVELTRAEKGFVIVFQDGQQTVAASRNLDNERLDLTHVSDSIIAQVVEHLQPVIVSDAMSDSRFGRAKSVVDLRLSSVMCVPLIYRNDLLGVIYLGNDKITGLFTERDLSLLRVFAAQAAIVIHQALSLNQLRVDNRNLRDQLKQASQGQIVGSSPSMKAVFKVMRRIAPTDLSVLILGETGTGKEMVARELHQLSPRKHKAFIAINCGAIPENLLESELFGHRKGSFTGAVADKIGKIEAASGGTLFLDEIGEMPMNLQVKLLRVLQERVIERVGDLSPRPVDIRLVAATNKKLEEWIQSGHFREDLYYRLNELTLALPPLRERGDDIEVLGHFFLNKYREQYAGHARGFTNQALTAMKAYYWPGNVRELENRIKKSVIMSDRALLNADDLQLLADDKRHVQPLHEAQEAFKADYIRKVLDMNNGNRAQTARDLGVDARTIFRHLEKADES